jgi:hypothetical protein
MLQAKADDFLIGHNTEYIAKPTNQIIVKWFGTLKYLVFPEDTSAGAEVGEHTVCIAFRNTTSAIIKIVLWFAVSIISSLILGQLT